MAQFLRSRNWVPWRDGPAMSLSPGMVGGGHRVPGDPPGDSAFRLAPSQPRKPFRRLSAVGASCTEPRSMQCMTLLITPLLKAGPSRMTLVRHCLAVCSGGCHLCGIFH